MAKELNKNDILHAGNRKKRWMEQRRPTWKEWLNSTTGSNIAGRIALFSFFILLVLSLWCKSQSIISSINAAGDINTTSNNPTTVPTGTTPTFGVEYLFIFW